MIKFVDKIEQGTTSCDWPSGRDLSVQVSENVSSISLVGSSAANGARFQLTRASIGKGCLEISADCFAGCQNLREVILPDTCRDFGNRAFSGCSSLSGVNAIGGDFYTVNNIGEQCFMGCNSLTAVSVHLSVTPSETQSGMSAFQDCANLKDFTFIETSYLSEDQFRGCSSLTAVHLAPRHGYVGPHALAGITGMKSVDIPREVWSFADGMFEDDKSLTAINIADGETSETSSRLASIGAGAFSGCDSLKELTLPSSIKSFDRLYCDKAMFAGSNLTCVRWNGISSFTGGKNVKELQFETGKIYMDTRESLTYGKTVMECAAKNHVPVFAYYTNKSGGCGPCKTVNSQLFNTAKYKNWAADSQYLFYVNDGHSSSVIKTFASNHGIKGVSGHYPFGFLYWESEDGKHSVKQALALRTDEIKAYHSSPKGELTGFMRYIDNLLSDYQGITKVLSATVDTGVSLFGLDAPSCLYIGADGLSMPVLSSGDDLAYALSKPQYFVDTSTSSRFEYGKWYEAAEQIKLSADAYGVPVLVECGNTGCTPCTNFARNIFNNDEFQTWVSASPYLFVEMMLRAGESWDRGQPKALRQWLEGSDYYASNSYIPQLMWYWKKPGESKASVYEVFSMHYGPADEQKLPITMQELMTKTDTLFRGAPLRQEFAKRPMMELVSQAGGVVGHMYVNEGSVSDDPEGLRFVCLHKTQIQSVEQYIQFGEYPAINRISVGQTVQFQPGTYQYDTTPASSVQRNLVGVIFRVDTIEGQNTVSYIVTYDNSQNEIIQTRKYSFGKWYSLQDSDVDAELFKSIIADAELNQVQVIMLKRMAGDAKSIEFWQNIVQSDVFKAFLDQTPAYFIDIQPTTSDYSYGLGKALKGFIEGQRDFDTDVKLIWRETVPELYIYTFCVACGDAGVYVQRVPVGEIPSSWIATEIRAGRIADSLKAVYPELAAQLDPQSDPSGKTAQDVVEWLESSLHPGM